MDINREGCDMEYIYKVAFKGRIPGECCWEGEYFFGSLAAIYDVFAPYQIGCKVENLWNVGVSDGKPYENSLCRITREPLIRKHHRKPSRQRK